MSPPRFRGGVGFYEPGNLRADVILWLLVGNRQQVSGSLRKAWPGIRTISSMRIRVPQATSLPSMMFGLMSMRSR